jgi:hypothetical protein
MGWTFTFQQDRKAFIAEITSAAHFSASYTPIESRVVGNHVWQLVEKEGGIRFITLDLIAKDRRQGWGYKGMDESWGPYHYDCPLSLLDKASIIDNESANAWRQKVREYHAAKQAKPAPKAGMVVTYCNHQYRLDAPAGPRRGWEVTRVSDGKLFRMNAKQLGQAQSV